METLTLTDEQVLELVCQLPEERREWLLRRLLFNKWPDWAERAAYGVARARDAAAARGLDWNKLTEDEREEFIDVLCHEP